MKKIIKLILSLIIKGSSMIITIFILRWLNSNLTPLQLQDFNLASLYSSTFITITSLGLGIILIKLYNSNEEESEFNKFWSSLFAYQLLLTLASLIFFFIIKEYLNLNSIYILPLLFVAQMLLAIDGNYKAITDYHNKSIQFTITEFLSKIIILILLYSFLFFNILKIDNDIYYVIILFSTSLMQLILDSYLQRKHIKWVKPNISILLKHRKLIGLVALNMSIFIITSNLDRFFIKFFNYNEFELNSYINAYKIFEIMMIIEQIVLPIFIANLIKNITIKGLRTDQIWKSKWTWLILINGAFSIILFLLASYFVLPFIDKNGIYLAKSYEAVPYLAIAALFSSISYCISQYFLYRSKIKYETYSLIIYLILSIVGYIYLIPPLGGKGAAIATLIGFSSLFISRIIFFIFDFKFTTLPINKII